MDNSSTSLVNQESRDLFLSLYHGSFDKVGPELAAITNHFQDFSIITNVPYGVQSSKYQAMNLQKTYRGFGKFLTHFPHLEHNSFVVSQAHHYGHSLSFEKYSNLGWEKLLHFSNGGINVNLLKWDQEKLSKSRQRLEAYD
jgi:hypothetical protein